jgi:hypothetical protein
VHIAVKIQADEHRHVQDQPCWAGIEFGIDVKSVVMPREDKIIDNIDDKHVDAAEYPSDELSVTALALHVAMLMVVSCGNAIVESRGSNVAPSAS